MNEMISLFDNLSVEPTETGSRAVRLHMEIVSSGEKTAEYLYMMCSQLKEMRDTGLYRSLGFETFDEYTEGALNMKRRQAYNYIRLAERLGAEFVQSNAQLGVTKLALLTEVLPSEREELMEENDLAETSVRELKAKIEELKKQTEQLSFLEDELEDTKAALAEAQDGGEIQKKLAELEESYSTLTAENERLRGELDNAADSEPDAETVAALRREIEKAVLAEEKKKTKEKIRKAVEKAEKEAKKQLEAEKQAAAEDAARELRESLEVIEAEKAEALRRAEEFGKKLEISQNSDLTVFKYLFGECQERFNKMLEILEKLRGSDEDMYTKLRGAVCEFLDCMGEAVN